MASVRTALAAFRATVVSHDNHHLAYMARSQGTVLAYLDRAAHLTTKSSLTRHARPMAVAARDTACVLAGGGHGLPSRADVKNDKHFQRVVVEIVGYKKEEKNTEDGQFAFQAVLPALLACVAPACTVEHIFAKVTTGRELLVSAARQVVTKAVEGPALYPEWGCEVVLHSRRSQIAFLVDRAEDTATGYAGMAFGSQNSLGGSQDPSAQTVIANQATALFARLAMEMDCASAASHKQFSGGNKGGTCKSKTLQAKGAPAPSAQ